MNIKYKLYGTMEAAMKQLFFDFFTHEEVNKNFL